MIHTARRLLLATAAIGMLPGCNNFTALENDFCSTHDASFCFDAGLLDAGGVDAGAIDSGAVDAGGPADGGRDAGPPDGGSSGDAGAQDAAVPDSGSDGGVAAFLTPLGWDAGLVVHDPNFPSYVATKVFQVTSPTGGALRPVGFAFNPPSPDTSGFAVSPDTCGADAGSTCSFTVTYDGRPGRPSATALTVTSSQGSATASLVGLPAAIMKVRILPAGQGTFVATPPPVQQCAGFDCYLAGTMVTLRVASVTPGWGLQGWLSCYSVTGEPAACGATLGGGTNDLGVVFAPYNRVFVSGKAYLPTDLQNGNADVLCQTEGKTAFAGTNWVAWVAGPTAFAPPAKLGGKRGWMRADLLPFADDVASLTSGKVYFPVALQLDGGAAVGPVITGTDPTGKDISSCSDWTIDSGVASAGSPRGGTSSWATLTSVPCDVPAQIYCFEVDSTVLTSIDAGISLHAFVSEAYMPSLVVSPDQECQNEGLAYFGSGTYRALIATMNQPAYVPFQMAGSWARSDGVVVFADKGQIFSGSPASAFNVLRDGGYLDKNFSVFTGSPSTQAMSFGDCNGWTSSSGTTYAGDPTLADSSFFSGRGQIPCGASGSIRLYCLQTP